MANPFYVPAKIRADLVEKLVEKSSTCLFCGEILKRPRDRHVDFINYDVENTFSIENSILCCADCVSARRRRPVGVFIDERFSELTVALAYISSLRTQTLLSVFKPARKSATVHADADVAALVDDWGDAPAVSPVPNVLTDAQVAALPQDDPRLDVGSVMFDEQLYGRWLDS